MPAKQYLLIVTEDGYGKRIAVDEIPRTKGRNTAGVKISPVPVAASLVIDHVDTELVIATAAGKIERLRAGDVPTRHSRASRTSKGARVVRLAPDDLVASVALVPTIEPSLAIGLKPGEQAVA